MIKATLISTDGQVTLLLGLSRQNTERLHDGQPIVLNANDVDPRLPELRIALAAGETEEALRRELERYSRPAPEGNEG